MNDELKKRVETSLPTESLSIKSAAAGYSGTAGLPILFHVLVAACLLTILLLSRYSMDYYSLISQEDHVIEWATVVFYIPAALIGLHYAFRHRRLFDGLVALFCLFDGGEEFSWGQRLLGLSPPKYFLEANVQQEISLHNFFGPSIHDLLFSLIVAGYFVFLPLLARFKIGRKLTLKLGATVPPIEFAPWAILLIIIYVAYPIHLSSEWIETIVAAFFLAATAFFGGRKLRSRQILISVPLVFLVSVILTNISNAQESRTTPDRVTCATAEVRNLLYDMLHGGATTEKLLKFEVPTHRRVYLAENNGYLVADRFVEFNATHCTGAAAENAELRHRYAIDPWGLSYWIYVAGRDDGSLSLTVYSYGPDRRRDSDSGAPGTNSEGDDDIAATGILPGNTVQEPKVDNSNPVFSVEPH